MAGDVSAALANRGWLYHPDYPDDWERCSLYSLARWVNGLAFRDIQFSPSGMPVIKIAEIKGGISGQTKLTEQTFDESVRVRPGDLLFSWSGQPETSIDAFWWRGPEGWLNQHVFRVTTAEGIDSTFFYYLLRYLKPNFVGIARNKQTTGLGHVTKRDLENIEGAYPVPAEQRAIAHILGTLDDKIELNRRMSETLEAMARALFKSWFVDFDPVRAKAEGRDPGLPKPLADLFPARLVDSELGEIPEGWEVGPLGELVDTVKGRSYRSEELVNSDTALVTLKSFARGGGYRSDGLKSFAGTYKPEQAVTLGEVVIACTDVTQAAEVIGRPAIVRGTGGYRRLVASLDTLIVRPLDSRISRAFLYFLGGTEAFVTHTYAHTTGTTVLHLAKEAVPSFRFARPSRQLVQMFDAMAAPALDRMRAFEEEAGTLAALRDALLPKLMSGELRVKNADRLAAGIGA
jgi:type I restriction enzyme S subunit